MVWNSNCDHFTYISFKKYLGSKDLKTSCILAHPNVPSNVIQFIFALCFHKIFLSYLHYRSLKIQYYNILFFRFGMATQLEKVVYPQFLHPLKHITLTASILMIVSLTLERYYAVHSPIKFHQVYISIYDWVNYSLLCRLSHIIFT